MKILMRAIGFCISAAVLAACGGHAAVIPTQTQVGTQPEVAQSANGGFDRSGPMFPTVPSRDVDFASLDAQRDTGQTIPFYDGRIKSPLDNAEYSYRIVGSDPRTSNTTTHVLWRGIGLRVHFPDGTVLDPMKPACGDTLPVMGRVFHGPNFSLVDLTSNGINVGKTEITDGFQRAEFWNVLKGPDYHTLLIAQREWTIVDVTAPHGSSVSNGVCSGNDHKVGAVDVNWMNSTIVNLAHTYAHTNEIAIFLTYNVFETLAGQCCVGGFHASFGTHGGTQVYTIGAYNDSGIFKNPTSADINTMTHELGDLLDDPFPLSGDVNSVPPWGGIGQVPKGKCQGNLETGDPLTGTTFDVHYDGFTYHPQELAFFSWFYRTPSIGTGGAYSFKGTFKSTQGLCFAQ